MTAVTRIADLLARMDPVSLDAFCLARVQATPGRVVLNLEEPAPEVGSVWVPTRGKATARTVVSTTGMDVAYSIPAWRGPCFCTLATWHRWVRRTRAVRG